jgi:rubrerythrin
MTKNPLPLQADDLKSAVREAIQTEKEAMDFYRYASERVYDPRARLTFRLLSREEHQHARSFYEVYPGDDLPAFEAMMEGPPNITSPWWQALEKARLADFNEQKALALAIEQEEQHEQSLRQMAERIEDVGIRQVYLANAEMTHRHLEAVSEDLDAISDI